MYILCDSMIYVVCLLACNRSQCLKHNRYIRRMDRDALAAALARFSAASVYHVRQLDKGEAAWHKQPSGAFKRAAKAALGPFHGCFKPLSVPSKEDASVPVVFYAADMKQVLNISFEWPTLAHLRIMAPCQELLQLWIRCKDEMVELL